ncbi:MAG: sodium:solute symporter family protein [Vicinamibacterales bacterium]|nr:sodium:solute symporter family protein [Vicinamibacterales bacterium]
MQLNTLDIVIIVGFLLSVVIVGSAAAKRASKSSADFFLSGRTMPWWLLGVSMVACTFSADTPNLVTDIVRTGGIAGNWAWWAFLLTGMLTVFVYAKLWRRSALDTDLGFYEIRYSGKPAAMLRGFRALYLGVLFNVLVMATVSLAAIKIGQVIFGLPPVQSLLIASIGVGIYATLGGLTGSIWADFYQYSVAMTGAIAAAVYAVTSDKFGVGSLSNMVARFQDMGLSEKLQFFPSVPTDGNYSLLVGILILPVAVQWWNVWYPGAEPGGGGYVAQRMLSAKDEKNAIGATMMFNFLHYAIRPWPWILVALVSLIVFPMDSKDTQDAARARLASAELAPLVQLYDRNITHEGLTADQSAEIRRLKSEAGGVSKLAEAFPKVDDQFLRNDIAYPGMISRMPTGLLGLIVASLIAAYMSTIATHLNWGSSYVVNDFYKRFVKPSAPEKELVLVGRLSMLTLLVLSGGMALLMTNAKASFDILLAVGAGTGLIYILRWFWWRINAWTEISAMIISFAVAAFFTLSPFAGGANAVASYLEGQGLFKVMGFGEWKLVIGIVITTIGWVLVTYLTPPVATETLRAFYRKVQPGGPGWKRVVAEARAAGDAVDTEDGWDVPIGIVCMILGCLAVWGALFGIGSLLYGQAIVATVLLVIAAVSTGGIMKLIGRIRMR